MRRLRFTTLALLAAATAACSERPAALESAELEIHASGSVHRLAVELAATEAQRTRGLMGRSALAPDAGMLFVNVPAEDAARGFWMHQTLIPLDIAFLDSSGRIVSVRTMEPCKSTNPRHCRTYTSSLPFTAALEVNAGYLGQRSIDVGDRVVLPARPGR